MHIRLIQVLVAFVLWNLSAQAQTDQVRIADAYGSVEKRLSPADTRWQPVSVGDLLTATSSIRTAGNSAVLLIFPDKHAFRIGERAEVQLKELGQSNSYSFELLRGQIWSFVNKARKPAKYEIETPSTVLGVSGTLFSVDHDPQTNESEVSVVDGEVSVRQGNAVTRVQKGLLMRMQRGQVAPARPEKHDAHTKQMWDEIQKTENWTKGNTAAKLNRQAEERLRNLKGQRREEQILQQRRAAQQQQRQRQQEQQKKNRAREKAKKK